VSPRASLDISEKRKLQVPCPCQESDMQSVAKSLNELCCLSSPCIREIIPNVIPDDVLISVLAKYILLFSYSHKCGIQKTIVNKGTRLWAV
jgi:hypothetical protein